MKNFNFKALIPHLVAIGIFLAVAIIYCHPAIQGKVLEQSDNVQWKAAAHSSFEYKEKNGHFPLWNTHLFSGMPAYQVAMEAKSYIPDFHTIFTLGLPKPVGFFFLACLCFYLLCCVLGIRTAIGVLGSLGFAYATYNALIIAGGHDTKMWTISYMPAVLAGMLLIYQKKYWIGMVVTLIAATWEIAFNHAQITYYFLIAAGLITTGYIIQWIRQKEWKHLVISLALAAIAGAAATANSAMTLLTTAEYAKYTMRGGKTIETSGSEIKKADTKGLDKDYAFQYSIGKSEILTAFMPGIFGESSSSHFPEDSKFVSELTEKNIPENQAIQLAAFIPKYWGGMLEGTGGTLYYGAIICFLALIGLVVIKSPIKWWMAAAIIFTIFMAWGRNFDGFNSFLLDHFPLYNKFRSPNTALVIPQFLLPLLAAMGLQQIFFEHDGKEQLKASFKKVLYVLGGLFGVTLLIYLFNDFTSPFDDRWLPAIFNPQHDNTEMKRVLMNALKSERKAMFLNSVVRALFFAGLVLGLLYLYVKNKLKPIAIVVIFAVINTIDLLVLDSHYLNSDNYKDADSYESENFAASAIDNQIMQDKDPHYRVFNLAGDTYNDAMTSYHHRSVGGYHPAKLRIYQDLIETQLAKQPVNMDVLDMLDTRYIIFPSQQQQGQPMVYKNDRALGAAWFIKHIKYVNGPVEEIKSLDKFGPKDTVIIDQSAKNIAGNDPVPDSTATIRLESYDNDEIKYSTRAASPQFAVFSEVYYPAGWNAYLDGQKTAYLKTDYLLRGMPVSAGTHEIVFKFEPASYSTGQKFIYFGNALFFLALAGSLFGIWKKIKNRKSQI